MSVRILIGFFFFLLQMQSGSLCAQMVRQVHGIPASAFTWNGKTPLADFVNQHYGGTVALILGKTDTSIVTLLMNSPNDATDMYDIHLGVIGKSGHVNIKEIISIDEYEKTKAQVNAIVRNVLLKESKKIDFGKLKRVDMQICPEHMSWVAKVNDSQLNKCFTWYFNIDNSQHVFDFSWDVDAGDYETTILIPAFKNALLVNRPCKYYKKKSGVLEVITGVDTLRVLQDTLPPKRIPVDWLPETYYSPKDSSIIKAYKLKVTKESDLLQEKYPLLKTHYGRFVYYPEDPDGILLMPRDGKPGKIYFWDWDPIFNICYYIETGLADKEGQKRYIKMLESLYERTIVE